MSQRVKPFLVFGLPRSRTAWLSHFLAPSPGAVGHDTGIDCKSISDFIGQFYGRDRLAGTCETGAIPSVGSTGAAGMVGACVTPRSSIVDLFGAWTFAITWVVVELMMADVRPSAAP